MSTQQTFVYDTFAAGFAARIETLEAAEKTTRDTLRDLSRDVLFALHLNQNPDYVNNLLACAMTVVNKKALRVFFQTFTGYAYDDTSGKFTKKMKSKYDAVSADALARLEDPHFNFWSWADREIVVQSSAFDPEKVRKFIESQIKKAEKDGASRMDVFRAVLNAGVTMDELTQLLGVVTQSTEEPAKEMPEAPATTE